MLVISFSTASAEHTCRTTDRERETALPGFRHVARPPLRDFPRSDLIQAASQTKPNPAPSLACLADQEPWDGGSNAGWRLVHAQCFITNATSGAVDFPPVMFP